MPPPPPPAQPSRQPEGVALQQQGDNFECMWADMSSASEEGLRGHLLGMLWLNPLTVLGTKVKGKGKGRQLVDVPNAKPEKGDILVDPARL
eukprot:9841387-Alexandrium_andersonii.AAC.1